MIGKDKYQRIQDKEMKIIVLCGGISTEREISIKSGMMICKGLRQAGHQAVLLDVYFGTEKTDIFSDTKETYDIDAEIEKIQSNTEKIKQIQAERKDFFGQNVLQVCQSADMVFMALHGKYGEDGLCQAAFDLAGIRYTGSGYLSSGICMDKEITKKLFIGCGVPTPKSVYLQKGDYKNHSECGMQFPVVVKACNSGSSVGVVIAKNQAEYEDALETCFSLDDKIIVEQFIHGREFSVGVLAGEALPIIEIIPKEGWYDYQNKYQPGATLDVCPAELSELLTKKMQKIAEDAYHCAGCEAYARVDIMMDETEAMYCLEINTLPGMTPTSLIPQEAAVVGMDFPALCDRLVQLSFDKYKNK